MRTDNIPVISWKRTTDPPVVSCQDIEVIVPKRHELLVELSAAVNSPKNGGRGDLLIGPQLFFVWPRNLWIEKPPCRIDRSVQIAERPHFVDGRPVAGIAVWRWLAIPSSVFY